MSRVLSLLLLIPFLTVQAWARRGGPYEYFIARSAYAGTYGVYLQGNSSVAGNDFMSAANDATVVGVMTMSVPSSGFVSGRVLLFNAGMMYLGNAQGVLTAGNVQTPEPAKLRLIQQMAHYTARTTYNGVQKQGDVVVDLILNGTLDLKLSLNYFTGLVEVSGDGKLYKFETMLSAVKTDQQTNTDLTTTQNSTGVTSTNTSSTTETTTDASGAITTSTDTVTTTGPSSQTSSTGSNTRTTQTLLYDPLSVRQPPAAAGSQFINLTTVTGYREDTAVAVVPPFAPPSEQTHFNIEIPVANTGGGGTGGTGGNAAGGGN
jgi:hypothetical protein